MAFNPRYAPNSWGGRFTFITEGLLLGIFIAIWIVEWIFGIMRISFSIQGQAEPAQMIIYAAHPEWYSLTKLGGGDWILLTSGIYTLITFCGPLLLCWIEYKTDAAYYVAGTILTLFGFFPEALRVLLLTIAMFAPQNYWYATAYGTFNAGFTPFVIIYLASLIRVFWYIGELAQMAILHRCSEVDRLEEARHGIQPFD